MNGTISKKGDICQSMRESSKCLWGCPRATLLSGLGSAMFGNVLGNINTFGSLVQVNMK